MAKMLCKYFCYAKYFIEWKKLITNTSQTQICTYTLTNMKKIMMLFLYKTNAKRKIWLFRESFCMSPQTLTQRQGSGPGINPWAQWYCTMELGAARKTTAKVDLGIYQDYISGAGGDIQCKVQTWGLAHARHMIHFFKISISQVPPVI